MNYLYNYNHTMHEIIIMENSRTLYALQTSNEHAKDFLRIFYRIWSHALEGCRKSCSRLQGIVTSRGFGDVTDIQSHLQHECISPYLQS